MSTKPFFGIQIDEQTQLRLIELRHAEEYFTVVKRNLRHLYKWTDIKAYEGTMEDLQAYIKHTLLAFAHGHAYHFGIWYQEKFIGTIDLANLDWRSRKTEIGYWIDAEMQGHGIMTRACKILINYAFQELKLNKVEITCATENQRSRAIPERLGFTLEGIHRQGDWQHDHFDDIAYYGLLAEEWKKR